MRVYHIHGFSPERKFDMNGTVTIKRRQQSVGGFLVLVVAIDAGLAFFLLHVGPLTCALDTILADILEPRTITAFLIVGTALSVYLNPSES